MNDSGDPAAAEPASLPVDLLWIATGAAIVLAVLADVFYTVLFPASGHGPLRKPATAATWALFRLLCRVGSPQQRRGLLGYAGPVIIGQTIVLWCVFLIVGWAMVFGPAMGTGIQATGSAGDTGWTAALYFSGFNFSTLGMGDLAPRTALHRLLAVIEAVMGFALLTMAMTYFLSVYGSLMRRNVFAHGLHHRTGATGDAAELLAGMALMRDGRLTDDDLFALQDGLREIYQSHHLYPVLRHFRFRESSQALPRVLLVCLDTVTLLRAALDPQACRALSERPSLVGLQCAAMELIGELAPGYGEQPTGEDRQESWRARFARALPQLVRAGFAVRADASAAAADYVAARAAWDDRLRALAFAMLYDWNEIDPAGDPASRPASGAG